MKLIAIFSLLILGCSAPIPEPNYDWERLERTTKDLVNRVEVLEAQNAALDSEVNKLKGVQKSYVDNYVGFKIKLDLLAQDKCPACQFDTQKIREPKVKSIPHHDDPVDVPALD